MLMTAAQRITLLLLRLGLGSVFLYAGITKILDPMWSAESYLLSAKNFTGFYSFLAEPGILHITNILNEWGLAILGIALILGIAMRITSFFSAILMLLYYLVILDFPYPNPHAFIVDEHIIYILVSLVLLSFSDNLALFSKTLHQRQLS